MFRDCVRPFVLARETNHRLDVLTRRAHEGKDLQAAKEFCSFVEFSGILTLLDAASDGQPEGLRFDPVHLRWKLKELLNLVHDQFRQPSKVVGLEFSQLEAMNHKLDLIAGQVAKFSHPLESSPSFPALTIAKEDVA